MEKQQLIDYCTCRDLDYHKDLLRIAEMGGYSEIPTEQEYLEAIIKFNTNMENYFAEQAKHWYPLEDDFT